MKIGIIGAGQIGGTLTRRLTALGHDVAVANSRGPESLADLAAETGAKPVSVKDAAKFGEVVVVTIPEKNVPDLLATCSRRRRRVWLSSTPAITIRVSATVGLTELKGG